MHVCVWVHGWMHNIMKVRHWVTVWPLSGRVADGNLANKPVRSTYIKVGMMGNMKMCSGGVIGACFCPLLCVWYHLSVRRLTGNDSFRGAFANRTILLFRMHRHKIHTHTRTHFAGPHIHIRRVLRLPQNTSHTHTQTTGRAQQY